MKRLAAVVLCVILASSLAGCGGGSSASPAKKAAPSPTAPGGDTTGGNPVDATALCAFLTKMEPRLKKDGSGPGAAADLAIELANWATTHKRPRTAADLDSAAQSACPATRKRLVALMGGTSFADTLG